MARYAKVFTGKRPLYRLDRVYRSFHVGPNIGVSTCQGVHDQCAIYLFICRISISVKVDKGRVIASFSGDNWSFWMSIASTECLSLVRV
jgi:hypothetical protein